MVDINRPLTNYIRSRITQHSNGNNLHVFIQQHVAFIQKDVNFHTSITSIIFINFLPPNILLPLPIYSLV